MPTLLDANKGAWKLWVTFLHDQYDHSEVTHVREGKEYRSRRQRFRWETAVALIETHQMDGVSTLEKIALLDRLARAAQKD